MVQALPCDVTDALRVQETVEKAEKQFNQDIFTMIYSVGYCIPGLITDTKVETYTQHLASNYLGAVYTSKAVLSSMVRRKTHGKIVFVNSAAGIIAFAGNAHYNAAKFAMRGFAEAMRNEALLYGIDVHIFFPGNMDTPATPIENRTKPKVTKAITGVSKLAPPESAASALINGVARRQFAITNEISCWALRTTSSGVTPRNNVLLEFLFAPCGVVIATLFQYYMDHVVHREARSEATFSRGKQA